MHPEKLGFEDCDINSLFLKVIDKETQTNEATPVQHSESSVKSYKLPLPRELEKPEEGAIKVFSFCQIIQDPECPKSITIVRESVTEEVHTHKVSPNDEAFSNRYRYCKEVIKPYLKDYPPDCPDSGELLIRDAIITANEEFPEYPPCYEVPVNESDIQPEHKTKQEGKYIAPFPSKKSDTPPTPQPKPDKDLTKKPSEKDIKPKQSKKDLIPAQKSLTSKKSDKSLAAKKSDKTLAAKKSDKSLAAKKSDKNLDKKQSKKDIAPFQDEKSVKETCLCKKPDSEDLSKKKSDKDIGKKKSEKEICKKKSEKDIYKKKSEKDLSKKKSEKDICKKKSEKDLIKKKSEKDICKKNSSKDLSKKNSSKTLCKNKSDKDLSPKKSSNKTKCVSKISTESPDPESDRDNKRKRDGKGGKRCKEGKGHARKSSSKTEDVHEKKPTRKKSQEDKSSLPCITNKKYGSDYMEKKEHQTPHGEDKRCEHCKRQQQSSGGNSDSSHVRESHSNCSCAETVKPETKPSSEDFDYTEEPLVKKSFQSYNESSQPLKAEFDEDCEEDIFPPELCAPEEEEETCSCGGNPRDDPPRKPENKNPKGAWPPAIGTKDNTTKTDSHHKKDCLGKLLESLRIISSDAESCTRKAEKSHPSSPKKSTGHPSCKSPAHKMEDCPSENPPRKSKSRSKPPPGSGLPIDACSSPPRESRSAKKVCKRNTSKSSVKNKDSGSKVGEKRSRTGAAASAGTGPCNVDEMVKGQLVQVQAEAAQLGSCTCAGNAVQVKSTVQAHHETLATLKCAMEDFMCKVFKSTQDAVTLITSESSKQLQKLRNSSSKTSDDCSEPPKKVSDNRSHNNLRRFSLVNIDNSNPETISNKKIPDCIPPAPAHENSPLKYLDALVSKVDSAMSMISDSLVFEIPKPLKPRSFNDSSSEYDIPHSTRPYPKDIGNLMEPESSSSMFTTLRDKIWSMFVEDEKPDGEVASKQSTGSITSESDEDLLHKMID